MNARTKRFINQFRFRPSRVHPDAGPILPAWQFGMNSQSVPARRRMAGQTAAMNRPMRASMTVGMTPNV